MTIAGLFGLFRISKLYELTKYGPQHASPRDTNIVIDTHCPSFPDDCPVLATLCTAQEPPQIDLCDWHVFVCCFPQAGGEECDVVCSWSVRST